MEGDLQAELYHKLRKMKPTMDLVHCEFNVPGSRYGQRRCDVVLAKLNKNKPMYGVPDYDSQVLAEVEIKFNTTWQNIKDALEKLKRPARDSYKYLLAFSNGMNDNPTQRKWKLSTKTVLVWCRKGKIHKDRVLRVVRGEMSSNMLKGLKDQGRAIIT